jgi:NADPH2:quinone reductase
MAKMIGTMVIATAGTDEKCEIARGLGADHVINYEKQDFEAETKRLTDSKGVNVVYDGVGKATFEKGLNILRPRGYMVLFGGASGAVPPFDLIQLSQKGSLYVTRPTLGAYIATREELEWRASDVMGWVASGKLKISIGQTYPLSEANNAHRDLEGRKTTGKTLLIP